MLLDIRLVFKEFSSFILERGKKTNMRMDAREVTGSNFQAFRASFSPPRGKTLYEKNILQYAGVLWLFFTHTKIYYRINTNYSIVHYIV